MFNYHNKYTQIFHDYGFADASWDQIVNMYKQPHRFYHDSDHLQNLLDQIEVHKSLDALDEIEYESLVFVAYFHDCVYVAEPYATNETDSASMFMRYTACLDHDATKKFSPEMRNHIAKIITDTATRSLPEDKLSECFWLMDNMILFQPFSILLEWERKIFKEWQHFSLQEYKNGRISFLKDEIARQEKFHDEAERNTSALNALILYVEGFVPRIGVYPGSFDPFHIGHYNILKKAEGMFDKVVLLKGNNPEKKGNFTFDRTLFPEQVQHLEIVSWQGMTHEYLKKVKDEGGDPILVRGLRNGKDLDYEVNQLRFMEEFYPEIKVTYIQCDKEYEHISSSAIRNLLLIDPKYAHPFLLQDN